MYNASINFKTIMNQYVAWTLIISGCASAVGFWAYTLEMIRGKVSFSTRWKDLSGWQLETFVLAVGGLLIFLGALIVGAILKGQA